MSKKFEPVVIPPGTKVYVLDHWTGHCAHKYGQQITVTGDGFHECENYPGCFEGTYWWEEGGERKGGHTTDLRVSLSAPDNDKGGMGWGGTQQSSS